MYAYGDENGRPYMVMEFLRGESLKDAIKEGHTGDLTNKLSIAVQIAQALGYIHELKIVHRDVKPENIYINDKKKVKLIDFGIAKSVDLALTALTMSGFSMGTPYYMPPEQVLGKEVTSVADIYAFGILLFELVTGARPIKATSLEHVFQSILNEPLDLSALDEQGVPLRVRKLIENCTAKAAEDRVQSFSAVIDELNFVIRELEPRDDRSARTVEAPTPAAARSRWLWVAAALLVLAGGYGLAVMIGGNPEPNPGIAGPPPDLPLAPTLSTSTGEMILIPGGSFLSGEDKQSENLAPFYIDRTEVTTEAYTRFCRELGRPLPDGLEKRPPDFPVVNITIVDAQEFAKWAGKRLPTMKEWEKAARGTDGRLYPWGNEEDPARANVDAPGRKRSVLSVGAMPEGATPLGLLNMVGNVWEFVHELRTPSDEIVAVYQSLLDPPPTKTEPWYVRMGGSHRFELAPSYEWASVPARADDYDTGFRCVKDPEPRSR